VLKAIPGFFETHLMVNAERLSENAHLDRGLRVDVVRSVGLLASRTAEMVADGTDSLFGVMEESGETYCCVWLRLKL